MERGRVGAVELAEAGLGLDYGEVALVEAREDWLALGAALAESVAEALMAHRAAVEHVGSTAVPGLLAKPILDLAVGVPESPPPGRFEELLELGWQYRGDAGDSGGLVFVLETGPLHRVAHIHVVRHDGAQWRNYIALRDRLRGDTSACARYASAKRALLASVSSGRKAYQAGKETIIEALLEPAGDG